MRKFYAVIDKVFQDYVINLSYLLYKTKRCEVMMEETMTLVNQPTLIKSKIKAAGIHLGISAVIFLIFAYFIIFKWYPFPYFTADGGWQGIRIVALIDLVLGPFLTLVIFNPCKSKREIRFDLSAVAFLQAAALIWGVYAVNIERPAAIVHWEGEFYTMPLKSYHEQNISLNQLEQFSTENPPVIHAHRPVERDKLMEVLNISTEKNLAPFEQFQLYRSFKENRDEIFISQLNIEEIIFHNETMKNELDAFLGKFNSKKEDYIYMPLNARYHNVILIFSKEGDVMGTLNAPYKGERS